MLGETQRERGAAILARVRPVLPVAAALLALLALWLAWSSWQQFQENRRSDAVQHARDLAVQAMQRVIGGQVRTLGDALAQPSVRSALTAGDAPAIQAALRQAWPRVQRIDVLPSELAQQYDDPAAAGGYARLAVAEAALAANTPLARIGGRGKQTALLVAAPAPPTGVVLATQSMALLGNVLAAIDLPAGSYLALRQGTASVVERGDAALAQAAEVLASPVPGTTLRVAVAVPDAGQAALGLGALPAAIAAVLCIACALACLWAWRRGPALFERRVDGAPEPTLGEAMQHPVSVAPKAAPSKASGSGRADAAADMPVDPGIFRAYDIRGVVGKTLDAGVAAKIGQAIGSLMQDKGLADIVVGRDGRLSGPDLVQGLVDGLRLAGRNVIDIGMVPTPVVYFGSYQLNTGCSVAVTGSHNPPDYNGFKIVVGGETLSGDAITDLHARIASGRLHRADVPGTVAERDIAQDYVERIESDVRTDRVLKVVVDAGNGVAGEVGPRVLEAIGADVTPLFCEIDGTFPNHHPDPSEPHNLEDLAAMVKRTGADLGLAFDGDGDRLGVVTATGENIFPDRLLMLFAADVLERNPGAMILYDVKCTGRLAGEILRNGGSPMMWKTGHSLVKAKMRETQAELAGEMSGHFFFAERWYGFDDGIYAAARLLEILSQRAESPTQVLAALPKGVSTPELKVDAPAGDPHAFVETFRQQAQFEGAQRSTIDGLRVDWPDGWGLVRASNTTPVLVMRFEADDDAALKRVQDVFRAQLLAIDPELQLPF